MLTSAIYFCVKLGLLQLYPAYICYKAIKVDNQQEFGSLLTFWIVSITYLSVEYFSDVFLFWVPFYTELKIIIVLWLILPQTQGTSVFYTTYLDPFLHSHQEQIDNALLEIQAKLKETIVLYGKRMVESIKQLITDAIFKGQGSVSVEQTVKLEPEATTAMDDGKDGYIMTPYNLFSTLITTAANRYHTPSPPIVTVQAPTPINSSGGTTITATNTAAGDIHRLDRTDSHDSLQSYVNVKQRNSANMTPDLSSQTPAGVETTTTIGSSSSSSSWGGYLASWVKKPSSSSSGVVIEGKKQN